MGLLHPKITDPEFLPRLRELRDSHDKSRTKYVVEYLTKKLPYAGLSVGRYVAIVSDEVGSRVAYHAIGMRVYRHLVATGEIDVPWWDAFVKALFNRRNAVHWAGARQEERKDIFALYERASKATTTEEAAEILRSIAPEGELVHSDT